MGRINGTQNFYAAELDHMQETVDARTKKIGDTPPFYVNYDRNGVFKNVKQDSDQEHQEPESE